MSPSPIPSNVLDKQLYAKIKDMIHKELKANNTRWGIYASSRLVRLYKKMGGRYGDTNNKSQMNAGLKRWFKERWINICESEPPHKIVECGRSSLKMKNVEKYPVCRPLYRVSSETPTTYSELEEKNKIQTICKKKRIKGTEILPKFKPSDKTGIKK